jgi:putative sterol carrier protein
MGRLRAGRRRAREPEPNRGMDVFSEEWSEACCRQLNERGRYRDLGRGWRSPVALLMRRDPRLGIERDRAVYLDLAEGRCNTARVASETDLERADYVLAADAAQWRRMLEGALDPITAVMFGKLKLERGSMASLIPHAPVARELIEAAREVEARFPEART